MNIKIESGAHVQITDKPIVNVFGDVNIGKKQDEAVDGVNAEDAEIVEEVKSSSKRGRPRKTGKAIQKSFVYRALTDADTNQRLQFLYNGLKQLQWIAANTLQKNFLKI